MLLKTHVIFGVAVGFLAMRLGAPPAASLAVAAVLSALINPAMDYLGHESGRRVPRTHEPMHAAALGAAVGAAAGLALGLHVAYCALAGAAVSLSHLLLDAFTEHGIYVRRGGRYRRFALAHLRYNDPAANGLAAAISLLVLAAGLL